RQGPETAWVVSFRLCVMARGRPGVSVAEHARRGTLQPCRIRSERKANAGVRPKPVGVRDYPALARGYARDVLDGRIAAGQPLIWQVERQERDLARSATDPSWPYVWSEKHVIDYCAFAESMQHIEGTWATSNIMLEPWQIFQDVLLFGWRRRDDDRRRRFTDWYEELARKGAKSVRAAIRLLYCFLREGENGPQVKCAATTGAQSRIIFDVIRKMVQRSPALREEYGLTVYANAITCDVNGGSLQPMNAKSSTQDGLSPSAYCVDELHAHKDRGLFDVLKSARGARLNPLSLYVTTAGYNLLGVCYEQRTILLKVLQQVFEADHFGGCIYTLDEHDEWTDERVWIKAN